MTKNAMIIFFCYLFLDIGLGIADPPSILERISEQFNIPPFHSAAFLGPNERMPENMLSLLKQTPVGDGSNQIHLSVGTERSLMGFAANPNATHLLIIDMSPEVTIYHKINFLLYKMSKAATPEERMKKYNELRMTSSYESWRKAAIKANVLDEFEEISKIVKEKYIQKYTKMNMFLWWNKNVRYEREFNTFNNPKYFKKLQPMRNIKVFEKIYNAVIEGRTSSIVINLSDENSVDQLVQILKKENMKLSAIDISNAWDDVIEEYLGAKKAHQLFIKFRPIAEQRSILLVTDGTLTHYQAYTMEYANSVERINFNHNHIRSATLYKKNKLTSSYKKTIVLFKCLRNKVLGRLMTQIVR